jgi:hypothetical protein
MPDTRCRRVSTTWPPKVTTFLQDLTVRWPVIDLPAEAINFFPQITQIDADDITKGPGLYLRYLRHLRAS